MGKKKRGDFRSSVKISEDMNGGFYPNLAMSKDPTVLTVHTGGLRHGMTPERATCLAAVWASRTWPGAQRLPAAAVRVCSEAVRERGRGPLRIVAHGAEGVAEGRVRIERRGAHLGAHYVDALRGRTQSGGGGVVGRGVDTTQGAHSPPNPT